MSLLIYGSVIMEGHGTYRPTFDTESGFDGTATISFFTLCCVAVLGENPSWRATEGVTQAVASMIAAGQRSQWKESILPLSALSGLTVLVIERAPARSGITSHQSHLPIALAQRFQRVPWLSLGSISPSFLPVHPALLVTLARRSGTVRAGGSKIDK
ncbi:hypothetical protein D9619_000838 [Psilocybe cf. subviscida]|uniref:Uncharacterized protein n=1 Tax=Psilocybe cf. subviscida TaxID=2480587 RepID=A0A8H5F2F4_9AGAR|nr:hypothetical protein D9619_000838 [Psilocybe cf. subviscida]